MNIFEAIWDDLHNNEETTNLNQTNMIKQLEVLRGIQMLYPDMSVGGSIGLFLCGTDVGRDLSKSDLDLTISYRPVTIENLNGFSLEGKELKGASPDIDYRFIWGNGEEGFKIEIQIDPANKPITIFYQDYYYRVTPPINTLKWKIKYAEQGFEKHAKDLEHIGVKFNKSLISL